MTRIDDRREQVIVAVAEVIIEILRLDRAVGQTAYSNTPPTVQPARVLEPSPAPRKVEYSELSITSVTYWSN
jgi:hypothetical protein